MKSAHDSDPHAPRNRSRRYLFLFFSSACIALLFIRQSPPLVLLVGRNLAQATLCFQEDELLLGALLVSIRFVFV
jgi:hypothetical protein